MITHQQTAGGRTRARRLFVSIGLVLAAMPCAPLTASDDRESHHAVTVLEEHGVYSVRARFEVPQSPAVALAVLTDYERIPRFMPGVQTSVVLERGSGRALIEQEAVSRLMMFSKRVHLVLEVSEGVDTVRFRDRSGRSFARYEGMWRLCEENGRTEIVYELIAQPSFDVPEFILKRLLRRDSGQMIESLKREMAARSGR
jgi:carbon monoxide dehydrogenase subunit G